MLRTWPRFAQESHAWTPQRLSPFLWLPGDGNFSLVSSKIDQWTDASGNGNHATAPTSGLRPATATKGASFDTTTGLAFAASLPSGAKTIAIVYKLAAAPGAATFVSPITLKTSGALFTEVFLSALGGAYLNESFYVDFPGITGCVGVARTLDTSRHVLLLTYDGVSTTAASSYAEQLDGAAGTVAASSNAGRTSTDKASLGARVSTSNAIAAGMNGEINEVVVTAGVLGATDKTRLVSYLRSKYGV